MARKLSLILFALGITASIASAETFKFTLPQDSILAGKLLSAGPCKVRLENGAAVVTQGAQSIEVPARVQTEALKFSSSALTYKNDNVLIEIGVGATHTKIVFDGQVTAAPGV